MDSCKRYILLLISIWISIGTHAQSDTSYIADIQLLSTADGLSHRNVLCVFQDRDDMVWIGAENGLNRYDGYHFKHWIGRNHGYDLRNIERITQDNTGWLWLIKEQEVIFFNPETEVCKTIKERFGENCVLETSKRTDANLDDFQVDNEGRIYFTSDYTNIMYSYLSTEGFKKITLPFNLRFNYFMSVSDDKEFTFHQGDKKKTLSSSFTKLVLAPTTDSSYAVKDSLLYFRENIDEKQVGERWRILEDRYYFFDENGNLLTSMGGYTGIQNVYLDKQDKYWISSKSGLEVVSIKKDNFTFLKKSPLLDPFDVQGIFVDSANIIATLGKVGMANYNLKTEEWDYLPLSRYNKGMFRSAEGLWITGVHGLFFRKNKTLEIINYPENVEKSPLNFFWAIEPSHFFKERLWLGSDHGLQYINTRTRKFGEIKNESIKDDTYIIQDIISDKEHDYWLWLCTNRGLILFDEKEEAFLQHYGIEETDTNYLPTANVQHLYQDEAGIYWLATTDGLIRWDKAKNEYRQITVADGLPDNVIYAIYPDDYSNLWMSSDHGIIRMDKSTFAIKDYLPKDGTGQKEFNRGGHFNYRDKDGVQRLFFGGLGGVTSFCPKDFQINEHETKSVLTILKYEQFDGNQKTVVDNTLELIANKKITIEPYDYIHSLEVGLLNYQNAENNHYRYQLNINGKFSPWRTQKSRFIQFGQLPYGKHQLLISASTLNNVSSKNDLTVDIVVRRPFYLQSSFIIGCILALGTSIFLFFRRRTNLLRERQKQLEHDIENATVQITQDKAKIQQQNEELRNLDKVKSNFFANISHELRTPLTLILGPLSYVLDSPDDWNKELVQQQLRVMQRNGKSLLQLIEEILDLSKLEANKLQLEEEATSVQQFFEYIFSAFEPQFQNQGLKYELVFNLKEDNLHVLLDRKKMEKVLNNYLSNAIKFTPKGDKIKLSISETTNQIMIKVTDTGKGVHQSDLPHIFERFYQSKQADQQLHGGTGIGLALVNEFANLMGGKAYAESTLGEGSQFYFELPKKVISINSMIPESTMGRIDEEFEDDIVASIGTDFTILVVEDNEDMRNFVCQILESRYNKVLLAKNGAEGLQMLRTQGEKIDLIVSDVMMPLMDGFTMLKEIKGNRKWAGVPVIMLTALSAERDKLAALTIGVDDYLTKPFSVTELLTRVQNLLYNYHQREAWVNSDEYLREEAIGDSNTDSSDKASVDISWVNDLEEIVKTSLSSEIPSIENLADSVFISPRQFSRRLKAATGLSPAKFIKEIQLQEARKDLEIGTVISIKEICYKNGFDYPANFTRLFKSRFGKSPSEYLKRDSA